jgi:hypothetical protein
VQGTAACQSAALDIDCQFDIRVQGLEHFFDLPFGGVIL